MTACINLIAHTYIFTTINSWIVILPRSSGLRLVSMLIYISVTV